MSPTLVILAAGLGRRFGGTKQLVAVGPAGETIMEYTVHDARRSGFGGVVLVIRPELQRQVEEELVPRLAPHLPVSCALQRLEDLPAGHRVPPRRRKPWGTGHAVLAARGVVEGPFAVANADDFYGHEALQALGSFLREEAAPGRAAMVGYRLWETVPRAGTVTRGLCQVSSHGQLEDIVETAGLHRHGEGEQVVAGERLLPGGTPVSMNLWAFDGSFMVQLEDSLRGFLAQHASSQEAELYLPVVVRGAITSGTLRVAVLPGGSRWFGITNPEDHREAQLALRELIDAGVYPEPLRP